MMKLSDDEVLQYKDLKEKFVAHYNNVLVPKLQQKEDFRLHCVKTFWRLVGISVVVLPLIIFAGNWAYTKYDLDEDFIFNCGFAFCIFASFILRGPFAKYKKQIKNDIMGDFISFFDNFSYKYAQKMDALLMRKSLIFPQYDNYEADDCFFGRYKDVGISVYEQKLTDVYTNSKGQKRNVTVFQGIAVEMDMNKKFDGHTIVLKDKGFFNRFTSFGGMERVTLEDVVFEKQFEVYSTNQVEARYILTTAFMERILRLKELYAGKQIEMSFYNNKILLAIDTRENMFEAFSFFKTNLNQAKFEKVFEEFWTLFAIVNVLKLNQNLGM